MCIYCRTTDEIHRHDAPAVSADGRGYRIDAGPGLPLTMQVANLAEQVRAQYERIEALEIMVLELRAREQLSREP